MPRLPAALEQLIHQFTRLPGIGRRGAERLALHLLESPPEQPLAMAAALGRLHNEVRPCTRCGNWAEADLCPICADPQRERGVLCVVERPADIWAIEEAGSYRGGYHVLGGALSPLGGVTAEDLHIRELEARIAGEGIREIILATNPSVDGDATAHYLARRLGAAGLTITRIAQGVPLGGMLGYADAGTLRLAMDGRRRLED